MTDPTIDPDHGTTEPDQSSTADNVFPSLTEGQEIGARFAAQMMGGEVDFGPPPPDSMLAWLIANRGVSREEVAAERRRRGQTW